MRAVLYTEFGERPTIEILPDPRPTPGGVVVDVAATGVCRSDWHGWMGHDPDIVLPHVPGHELAGTIAAVGSDVTQWHEGDRITVPFVCGCGTCEECTSGNHQVCHHQFQPGFTHWGSFADYVALDHADVNLVRIPDSMDFVTAASLGCRFATSYRAIVDQAEVVAGEWVAVHGCGGVGLSAVMIAAALGAQVVAIDIRPDALRLASSVGATAVVAAGDVSNTEVVEAVRDITGGGAHVSVDALGSASTAFNSVANLRRRGRHVQIGLMTGDHADSPIPFSLLVSRELRVIGSHGMQASRYPDMLSMIESGRLSPGALIGRTISLAESIDVLIGMNRFDGVGVAVIDLDGSGHRPGHADSG